MTRTKKKNGAQLAIEYVAVDKLKPDPENPRSLGAPERERLKRILREHGFVLPLVVRRSDNRMIGGHQRLEIAKELGFTELPIVYRDNLTDDEARLLGIALNNEEAQGKWDHDKLSSIVRRLNSDKKPLAGSGFSDLTLKGLLRFDARQDKNGGNGAPAAAFARLNYEASRSSAVLFSCQCWWERALTIGPENG